MNKTLRLFCGIPGLGLMLFGALCTAYVFNSLAPISGSEIPYLSEGQFSSIVGFLFEIGKMGLMMAAIAMFSMRKYITGLVATIMTALLVSISMYTTFEFISADRGGEIEVANSEITAIQRSIEVTKMELGTLEQVMRENSESSQRQADANQITFADNTVERNNELARDIRETGSRLSNQYERLAEAEARAIEPSDLQSLFYIIIAVMFDLTGMICWAIATWRPASTERDRKRVSRVNLSEAVDESSKFKNSLSSEVAPVIMQNAPITAIDESETSSETHEEPVKTIAEETLNDLEKMALEVERRAQEKAKESVKREESHKEDLKDREAANDSTSDLTDDEAKLIEALRAGQIKPKKVEVRQFMRIGDKKAIELLKSLLEKGELDKEGRFYVLPKVS